jgi:hypothetical protein
MSTHGHRRSIALPCVASLGLIACSGDDDDASPTPDATTAEPEVSFVVEGENAGFQVFSEGNGSVGVVVTGTVEWEGSGTADISGGSVTISGSGSPQDDSAVSEDFTIDAEIESC